MTFIDSNSVSVRIPAGSPALPARPADGHKGTFGRVLIVGGSLGMSGSVCLAGVAALRSGSGLVTLAVPENILSIVAAFEPSYMTVALPFMAATGAPTSGEPARIDDEFLIEVFRGKDVIAIGPGLGAGEAVTALTASVLRYARCTVVIDADGINAVVSGQLLSEPLGTGNDIERRDSRALILTPHPGEFSRLSGLSIEAISVDRVAIARNFAASRKVILVLKGAGTVVTDGDRVYVNPTGNVGMATGGSGDVLTGVIASLVGQRMTPFDAACLGVFVHGLAGDLAATALTQRGMIASDLIHYLPAAWKLLEHQSQAVEG
jgi:ADP-dependent NAD(P)H-hydrate dehydratase